ncbi:MAG: RecQ family ATP-dependent DNA helicase [Nocardiaceae bacterium]|nr:RecQ family ATP-dependent DNA helicase [Nocardiaceae bacterium]
MQADVLLTQLAGDNARLRDDQWTAIEALVEHRRRALVVQRTGWGKSAVYFIAAKLLRSAGRGPTVIISPLLALMRNQVAAAERAGVVAETINSGNMTEWQSIHGRVAAGELDVLLISPERLNNPDFRDNVLPHLAADAGMVVVDEAHCVSDWGHDFRPDYRRIRTLLGDLPSGTPVLATTATANNRVVADIAEQLGVGDTAETLVLRGGLDRTSLHLSVVKLQSGTQRVAWLVQNLKNLPGSGIIYSLTVAGAEDLASVLSEQGYPVRAYTGKTDPSERETLEQDLLANRVKALVATSALGMGFDKPDLGFVVHVGAPSSPIAYYQQVGRAGRGAERAEVLLMPGAEDRDIWKYFASVAFPPERMVRDVLDALDHERPQSTPALEPRVDLNRSRLEMVLKVLDVDGAVRRVQGGWIATGEPWNYDADRYQRLEQARMSEQQAMLDFVATSGCRMNFLRSQLDDPELNGAPCGRCDNCTGPQFSAAVDADAAAAANDRLTRPGIDLEPRKQWPSGLANLGISLKGRITTGAEPGRAIGRLTDLGWGQRLRPVVDGADAPVDESVVSAAIQVLKAWTWNERPVAVLGLDTGSHPMLVQSLTSRLAALGRLDDLGFMRLRDDHRGTSAQNSAYRVAALLDAWDVPPLPEHGPILLVAPRTDTGWTLALAAHALRQSGAQAVLPFAVAAVS